MSNPSNRLNSPRLSSTVLFWLALTGLCALAGGAALAWFYWDGLGPWVYWGWGQVVALPGYLRTLPAWGFMLAIAVLFALPVPCSPFFIAAGIAYGWKLSLVVTAIGLFLNLTLCYWISAKGFRKGVVWALNKMGFQFPELPSGQHRTFVLLVRLTPGLPLVAQNYILGLSNVPYRTYISISWPITVILASGLVLMGGSFHSGSWGLAITAVFFLLFILVLSRFIYASMRKSKNISSLTKEGAKTPVEQVLETIEK